ncbi:cytochrome P450 [Nocardia sp. GAS34]|uniref:cytochrome P450 n=1 Tax=unclassified Nocardia TaxID=2637762 RepID=UPI003D221D04
MNISNTTAATDPAQAMLGVIASWVAADTDVLWLVPDRNVLLKHPDHVRTVLTDPTFTKETGANVYFREHIADGILTAPPPRHEAERLVLKAAMHDPWRLERIATEHVDALAAQLQQHALRGERPDLTAAMSRLTLGVIAEALLGWREIDVLAAQIRTAMTVVEASGVMLPPPDQLAPVRNRVLRVLGDMIDRQPPAERGPALAALIHAGYSAEAIAAQTLTLLLAGHETTANSLSWTWVALIRTPQVYARWQRRMQASPRLARAITGNITREGLRLFPASWVIGRTATVDTEIGGVTIPAGCTVTISPYVTHRHRGFWGPNPEAFDPDRHNSTTSHRFAWLPFGAGPRMCLGLGYALAEIDIVLSQLGQRFIFHSKDADTAVPRLRFTLGAPPLPVEIELIGDR